MAYFREVRVAEVRPRRRNDDLLEAIHRAVLAELSDHGYAGVTFEGVARRAHTSKPVLYRRYRSRAHMVVDAARRSAVQELTWKPTGSLRDDLLVLLGGVADQFRRFGTGTYLGIISEADDKLIEVALGAAGTVGRATMAAIFDAARQRGELGPAPISDQVASTPVALIRHGSLFLRQFDEDDITSTVDNVVIPLLETASRKPPQAAASSSPEFSIPSVPPS
ncbi:MAG: TetR/AcrR family transcriptional regulator [Microbacteriaceae bacterium]